MNEQSPNESVRRVNPAPIRERARELASRPPRPNKESAIRTAKYGLRFIERGAKGFVKNFDPRGREVPFYAAGIGAGVVESVIANSILGPVLGPPVRAALNIAVVQGVEVGFNVYRKRFIERELSKVPGIENATDQDVAARVKEIEQRHRRASKKLKDFMAGLAVGNVVGSLGIFASSLDLNIDAPSSPTVAPSENLAIVALPPPDVDQVVLLTESQKSTFDNMLQHNLVSGAARDAMGGYGDYVTLQGTGDQMGSVGEKYVNATLNHFNLPETARTSVEALVKKQVEEQSNNIFADLATRTTDVNMEVAQEGALRLNQALENPAFQEQMISHSQEKLAKLVAEINNPAVMPSADVVHLAGIPDTKIDEFINNSVVNHSDLSKLDYNQLRGVVFDNLAEDIRPRLVEVASSGHLTVDNVGNLSNIPMPIGTAWELADRAQELIAENQKFGEGLKEAVANLTPQDPNAIERLAQNFGVRVNSPEWFDAVEDYLESNWSGLVGAATGGFLAVGLLKVSSRIDMSRIINRARNGDTYARRVLNNLLSRVRGNN